MGFSEVILIGVDHNFVDKGLGGKAVLSNGPDQNHFSKDYFGKGVTWQLPNLTVMEKGFTQMKHLYESNGKQVVDATFNGRLQIFPKVEFQDYLKESKYRNKYSYENN